MGLEANGDLVTLVDLDAYAEENGTVLDIYLKDRYVPRAVSNDVVELNGDRVGLPHLGINTSARKLVRYWNLLEQVRGFNLSEAAKHSQAAQAEQYGLESMLPPLPLWSPIVELVGFMYYFDNESPPPPGWEDEIQEIKSQVNGVAGSDALGLSNYEQRLKIGLPNLTGRIQDFASELRFGYEMNEAGVDFRFNTEGGVDYTVNSEYRVEVTKKRATLGQNASLPKDSTEFDFVSAALRHSLNSIQRKLKKNPDVIAVDISGRLPGFEMVARRMLSEYDYLGLV